MFTNYFIKKKIQALVSDAGGRPHRSLSLDEARSLLVLYNIEDHEDVMPTGTAPCKTACPAHVLGAFAQGEEGYQDVCVCAVRRSGYSFRRFQYSCTYKERSQRVGISFR